MKYITTVQVRKPAVKAVSQYMRGFTYRTPHTKPHGTRLDLSPSRYNDLSAFLG